jgi:hypothetical protein
MVEGTKDRLLVHRGRALDPQEIEELLVLAHEIHDLLARP